MKFRQYSIIFIFLSCCFVLVALTKIGYFNQFGSSVSKEESSTKTEELEESFFKNVKYYLQENNNPIISFNSQTLTLSMIDSVVFSELPQGTIYRQADKGPINFSAQNSKAQFNKREVLLNENVVVGIDATTLKSDKMNILINDDFLSASGHVQTLSISKDKSDQVLINADEATYQSQNKFFEYKGNVKGVLKRKKLYEESVNFQTNVLNFDANKGIVELLGGVHLIRDRFDVYANNGSIFLENYNKKLKYYSLSDDVRLEERVNSEGRSFTRKAFSEKLEGIMSEKRIILTGYPKVFQEKDVIKGNKIIIRENIETVEVDDANTNIILKEE